MSAEPLATAAFHHMGLAVRSPKRARAFLETLGYAIEEAVRDDVQGVHLAMAEHPRMPRVELVWPTESSGPLDAYLRSAPELVYHVCYEVDDAERAIARFKEAGSTVRCVCPPVPAVLFQGREVSFYLVAGIGLVELLARSKEPS
jgi:methylmalonyl-CoA/ethylmalonyl-CoA epimerase